MTIRDLLGVLVKAADLDRVIKISTYDGADLESIAFADIGSLAGTDTAKNPRLVLALHAQDCAVITKKRALEMADGDPETLAKFREWGLIQP